MPFVNATVDFLPGFGVENAVKVLKGETISKRIDTGTLLVDKSNADTYKEPLPLLVAEGRFI
ncbi:MAG: hypothetical protein HY783_04895, partial [Chloroflexi bacterium]|nr:hypothetical protein [Chloroflexota bacterium]